ncbi:MAG: ABC transporter transmembrane domain-containing protein, partial [Intestinibacter sp.]
MEFLRKVISKIKSGMLQEMYRETKWMYTYAWKYRYQILFYIVLGLLTIWMSLKSSFLTGDLINAINSKNMNMVVEYDVFMVGLAVVTIIVNGATSMISARINIKVNNEIQAEVYDKILVTDWVSMQEFHSGDILNRLSSDVNTVSSNILGWLPSLVRHLVQFVWTLWNIIKVDFVMAIIALISAPVMIVSSKVLIKNMRSYNKEMRKVSSDVMAFNEESFQHLQSIKSFDLVEFFGEKFRTVQKNYKKVFLEYNKFSVYTSSFMSILGLVTSYACLGWAVYHYLWMENDLATLMVLIRLSGYVTTSFKSLVGLVPSAISATTCAGRIMEFFDLPKENRLDDEKVQLIENNTKNMGLTIELEGAKYSYDDTKVVFEDANVEAAPGEIIALVGPSGEGKTTMIRLFLGLINTKAGRAVIKDINGLSCNISSATRRFFAYVPQGNTIFSGTVA